MKNPHQIDESIENQDTQAFINRLRKVAAKVGSVSALAKKAGISQSGIQRYFAGGDPTRKMLIALAEAANINLHWLITGYGEMDSYIPATIADLNNTTLVRIPFYQMQQPAAEQSNLTSMAFCYRWLASKEFDIRELVALIASGNSMDSTIKNGDIVLMNIKKAELIDGGIYAIQDGNTLHLKRIYRQLGGKLQLINDNPAYPTTEIDGVAINIVGRVVWRGSFL